MSSSKHSPRMEDIKSECQLTMRLLELLHKTEYELVQENGQRRLTAPEVARGEKQRTKGAEVFLGRLPRDCYEDELMPMLERIGRLIELRLMLDFSGSTRGYAFALYEDSKTARKACAELDGYEIRPGHRIGVVKSVDNCRLFFGGVPKNKGKAEFMEELTKILDGIVDIYLYPNAHDKTLNRGFIFVEFKDHRAAAMARRKLIPGKVMLWDHEIAVDWADPEPGDPVDEEVMETVTALFVRNLSLEMPQQKLKEIFQRTTKIPILKLKKINHFAFIHYEHRQAAQAAMDIMTKPHGVAEKEGWEIRWAKPIGASKALERQRCINEAIAKPGPCRGEQIMKQTTPKSRAQSSADKRENQKSSVHVSFLQNFVKEKLDAMCLFECLRVVERTAGFMCKILIFKENSVMFEYHGAVMPTRAKAINSTTTNVYYYLTALGDNVLQALKHHFAWNENVNPVIASPTKPQNALPCN